MKKNGLTTAVIAGIAGVAGVGSIADAVNLNPDGLGQVLIYPYYTTQGGNDTLFSVVNTAPVGKAVKVRFLEGLNSREVLDFHLYLSRFDVWAATIASLSANGLADAGAAVLTVDRSCTVPDIARGGLGYDGGAVQQLPDGRYYVPFTNFTFADAFGVNDGEFDTLDRTDYGYIEVIEMADIERPSTVNNWIEHVNGEPANCLAVNSAWFGPGNQFILDPEQDLIAPTGQGQLFGNAMIVNPSRGTISGYAADAIEGFNYTILHQPPGDTNPGLDAVNNPGPDLANATAYVFRFGNVVTATYPDDVEYGKVDAISALYASPRVINEYYLDSNDIVTASSEWVLTFPTKRYYVDTNPALPSPPANDFVSAVRDPFSDSFGEGGACQDVSVSVYDREERTATVVGGGFSPRPPGPRPDALCWEAQVVTFGQADNVTDNNPSNILGSTNFKNVQPNDAYQFGWAYITFQGAPTMRASSPEGVVFAGLPITGFFATNYDNAVLDEGVLANYSALFRHRTERSCTLAIPTEGELDPCS
jgi:hypothetical protein